MQQTNKLPDDKKGEIVGYLDKIEQLKQNKQAKEEGSSGYERNELNELRGNDPKIPTLKPSRHASLFDLPFPLGYRGLPDRAVRAALAWCDAKQVTDRIEVMWTVMVWVLDHFKMVKYLGPLYQKVRERERELWTDLTGSDDDPTATNARESTMLNGYHHPDGHRQHDGYHRHDGLRPGWSTTRMVANTMVTAATMA